MRDRQSRSPSIASFFIRDSVAGYNPRSSGISMRRMLAVSLLLSLLLGRSLAQDDPQTFNKKRLAAIEKGIEWLKKAQAPDGSWSFDKDKPLGVGLQMKPGCTALCALALLK